jgi:copper chaperone CopZ
MRKKIFIEGMKCENCAKHVKEALSSVEGITGVDVILPGKYALVELNGEVNDEIIKLSVNSEKYKVVEIETI